MRLNDIVTTSARVAATRSRLAKIAHLTECLGALAPGEITTAVAWLSGELRQGRIGVGYAALRKALPAEAADTPTLEVTQVDETFSVIADTNGAGSAKERHRLLGGLLAEATRTEQDFIVRLLIGELRQGALEGVMVEAIARAANIPSVDVRRAAMLAGDPAAVAQAALAEGARGLAQFSVRILRPVKPMLADVAEDAAEALRRLGTAAFEFKMDGARVQVHKSGADVRVFTRQLNDVTAAVPEVVEYVRQLPVRELILDGETLALRADGTPHAFQTTMRRFGRKLDVAVLRERLPLAVYFFDCLYVDGDSLIEQRGEERFRALAGIVPGEAVIPRMITGDVAEADAFFQDALRQGHEGVMAKALDASYEAGSRGSSWLKIKHVHTLDLVVLAAEWGHGRRKGWLSNLHLGARDLVNGEFVMLGKTFKGMTDAMLQWQTAALRKLETKNDKHIIYVRPELVVEVAFNELQASKQYPGGLALRFARIKGYRADKKPEDADTIDTVRAIYSKTRPD